MTHTLELAEEEKRCYAIKLLTYEMTRYHMRKMDFHQLVADVLEKEFKEDGQFYLLADNDSYSKFDESAPEEVLLNDAILNESISVKLDNDFIETDEDKVKVVFFQIYDDVNWGQFGFDLPESKPIHSVQFIAQWHWTGLLKWLARIDVIDRDTKDHITNIIVTPDNYRSIAFSNGLYCALFDEDNELELGIFDTNEEDIAPKLYDVLK